MAERVANSLLGLADTEMAPANPLATTRLNEASFGAQISVTTSTASWVANCETEQAQLLRIFYNAHGLLIIKGLHDIPEQPELLVRLSRLFGSEVENYHETVTPGRLIHPQVGEILVLSNLAPMNFPVPDKPQPEFDDNGDLPTQFPHRKGWHTDQSFRRPPPDVSLLYAIAPTPKGQGQTLYADGTAAYATLDDRMKKRVANLQAIHAIPWTGRGEDAVRAGETPKPLTPHQASQRQPIVRRHPVTGEPALYLCEEAQLDWILGPIAEMTPGPDNAGGKLIYELMTHYTQPQFTYVHDWDVGDLVIADNRNMLHSATWFDGKEHGRVLWRTTVRGNPGDEYAGETPSWLPPEGNDPMGELDYADEPS